MPKLTWLKEIIGDAYTEEMDADVSKKIGELFVSREDFNTVNTAKKTLEDTVSERDKQLEQLKNSTGDIEALKTQITTLQNDNKAAADKYAADIAQIRLDNAAEKTLTAAGAKNIVAVKALLAEFLKGAKVSDDGTVKGLEEEIKKLSTDEATSFLFNVANPGTQPNFAGMQPGNPGGSNPTPGGAQKNPKDMSYTELCDFLEKNPNAQI